MRRTKLTTLLAAVALLTGAAAATSAHADSIVYVKQGNLYLTSPDGSQGYQLTYDGNYSSPSQADNGTIGAVHGRQLVRMDRSGRPLNAPIDAMGTDGTHGIAGPYEARISPDGTRFVYWFFVQTSWSDYANNVEWIDTGSYTTWTYADHFTSPGTESEFNRSLTQAEWISNDRVVGNQGFWMNIWTWKLGTGHGYTSGAEQFWFGLSDPYDPVWDVTPAHWYDDPSLSPDGSKLAMTGSAQEGVDTSVYVLQTHGPAWVGEPPVHRRLPQRRHACRCARDPLPPRRRRQRRQSELVAGRHHAGLRRTERRLRDERPEQLRLLPDAREADRGRRHRARRSASPT